MFWNQVSQANSHSRPDTEAKPPPDSLAHVSTHTHSYYTADGCSYNKADDATNQGTHDIISNTIPHHSTHHCQTHSASYSPDNCTHPCPDGALQGHCWCCAHKTGLQKTD